MRAVHAIAIVAFLVTFAVSSQWARAGVLAPFAVLLLPFLLMAAVYAASIIVIAVSHGAKIAEWPQIAKRLFSDSGAK